MQITLFWRKVLAVSLSIVLLSLGWLGATGLLLFVALVPLLWISAEAEDSRRGWWSTFGWALLTFVGWNLSTIWWIGYATPIGPVAATLASSFYSMLAFMIYHTISKRAPKALAYTAFVSLWIAFEYNYTVSDFSWPWLLLGNGFSNDVWAIQWYEYTGMFGGSLWVLISNLLIFEASRVRSKQRIIRAVLFVVVPMVASVLIGSLYADSDDSGSMEISVIQPNVDCYDKSFTASMQERNLLDLLSDVSATADLVLMPEGSVPRSYWESSIENVTFFSRLAERLRDVAPEATLVCGTYTLIQYAEGSQSDTARPMSNGDGYYDIFNTAIALDGEGHMQLRHKAKLVIGVENTPTWVFDLFKIFVVEIGDDLGQIGKGTSGEVFDIDGDKVGVAICYEGLYGDFYGDFVRDGAELMSIISNDCWWSDTPGHRHLYSISSIRAIEQRRAIARSANTGTSGFIDAQGKSIESLGWQERGVITQRLGLNSGVTLYARFGDYIARVAIFIAALSLLYYISYRARKRHYLVS